MGTAAGPDARPPADPDPTLSLNPTRVRLQAAQELRLEPRLPAQAAARTLIFDVAYVGSESKDLLRQLADQRGAAGGEVPAPEPGPDPRAQRDSRARPRCPTTCCGPSRATATSRCGTTARVGNYHALQTGAQPPVRQGRHVLGLLRLEQGPDPRDNNDFAQGGPPACQCSQPQLRGGDPAPRLLLRPLRPAAQLRVQLHLPDAQGRAAASSARVANDWQISGIYRWIERPALPRSPTRSPASAPRTSPATRQPSARVVVTCDPGTGSSSDPYRQINTAVLRSAAAGQRRRRVGPLLPARPADQQPRPVLSKNFPVARGHGSRCASTPSTRSTTRSSRRRQQHGQLRQPDRPDDHEPALRRERATSSGQRLRHHQRGPRARQIQLVTRLTF